MPWTEAVRAERELMRWFRSLPSDRAGLVRIGRRARGYTATAPRRRVPDGRNVWCALCPGGRVDPVWFTNEPGDRGRRAAQLAAARHLRGHLTVGDQPGMPPESGSGSTLAAETPASGC